MYRIWQGSDPKTVLAGLGFFLTATALVIHLFAFNVVGYPATTKAKYNPTTTGAPMR